jgi:DNA-binding transcriptional LysR family regulator
MTLTELRYAIALAETKHFGHASAMCNVQCAMSANQRLV